MNISAYNYSLPTEPRACKVKDFDLNDTCDDMEGFENGQDGSPTPAFKAADSPNCPSWMQQDSTQSPPQTSGNSDSTSTQSLSSSNGDAQVCHRFLATSCKNAKGVIASSCVTHQYT